MQTYRSARRITWTLGLLAFVTWASACAEDGSSVEAEHPFAEDDRDNNRTNELGASFCEANDCAQLVNAQMATRFQDEEIRFIRESDLRLCRRMSLDLTDLIPTWEEVEAHCLGRSAAEMADYFMSKPEYVLRGQRWWADVLMYNDAYDFAYWRFIEQVDERVGELMRDELPYDDFVELVLAHPYYVTRFSGQDRVNKAFALFMGRDALPVESGDFEAWWRIWDVIGYQDVEYGQDYRRPVLDTRDCAGGTGTFLCESTLLGRHGVRVPLLDEDNPNDFEANMIDLDDITEAQWEILRTPGRVFSGQRPFWEAGVDRVLARFLGWEEGKDAFARPPGDALPATRDAVTSWFMESRSWPELERTIVTSSLYTAANRREDSGDLPIWAMGPLKQMTAEQWFYAIQTFTGYELGDCDHRYPNVRSGEVNDETYYHPHNYPLSDEAINRPDFSFRDAARVFGGCPDRDVFLRQTSVGVVLSLEAAGLVNQACFPEGSRADEAVGMYLFHDTDTRLAVDTESRVTLFRQHFREALTQEPTADDLENMLLYSDVCLSDLEACPAEELPNRFCASLLRSNEFLFY